MQRKRSTGRSTAIGRRLISAGVLALIVACGGFVRQPDVSIPPIVADEPDPEVERLSEFLKWAERDLNAYWAEVLPGTGLGAYRAPTKVEPYLPGSLPDLDCLVGEPVEKWQRNAVYCRDQESIGYELGWIAGLMQRDPLAGIVILAHEWGHHVSKLAQDLASTPNSIQRELMADCYAGMWASDAAERTPFPVAGEMEYVLGSIYLTGHLYSNWWDPGVHGTPRERVRALTTGILVGINQDVSYCRDFAMYVPNTRNLGGGYTLDVPANITIDSFNNGWQITRGDVTAELFVLPATGELDAATRIGPLLDGHFTGTDWTAVGGLVGSGEPLPLRRGDTAVQVYQQAITGSLYTGAAMLHVAVTGDALLLDVYRSGHLDTSDPDTLEPIQALMYVLLSSVCPPGTEELSCARPFGATQ